MQYLEKQKGKAAAPKGKVASKGKDESREGKSRLTVGEKQSRYVEKYDIRKPKDGDAVTLRLSANVEGTKVISGLIVKITATAVHIVTHLGNKNYPIIVPLSDVVSVSGGLDKASEVTVKAIVQQTHIGTIVEPKDGIDGFIYLRLEDKTLVGLNSASCRITAVPEKKKAD